jgi:7,8-dihydropterin-6-yl-methyl-4-(beta-D-ribofuranosyl)aminobenzene 5'-phosphate synthase
MLLQTDKGENYLIDTGASGKFLENLEILRQTDPSLPSAEEIDAVIISHGHNDHTGGLRKFFEANETAPVYLHPEIKGNWFFSCRPKNNVREARSIGIEQSLFAEYSHRFIEVSESLSITENLTIIAMDGHPVEHPMPIGNKYLYKNDFPDDFSHETAVLIEFAPQQYAIISPCSHCGILNILDRCIQKLPIGTSSQGAKYFIGGLHYVDYLGEEDAKKEAAHIVQAAEYIKEHYPNLKVISGHCTGNDARQVLQNSLKENYTHFSTGTVIELK